MANNLRKSPLIILFLVILLIFNFPVRGEKQFTNADEQDKKLILTDEVTQIKIAVTGDILMAGDVKLSAAQLMNDSITDPYKRVASGFKGVFSKEVREQISSADLAFSNLETTIAEGLTGEWYLDEKGRPMCKKIDVDPGVLYDEKAYRGTGNAARSMNAHPALALALKNIGFDIINTANNHFNNRGSNGIDATIDSLRKANLTHVGTLRYDEIIDEDNDGFPDNTPFVIKEVKGVKIAFFGIVSEIDPFVRGHILLPFHIGKLNPIDEFLTRQTYYISSNNAPIEFNLRKICSWIEEAKNQSDIVVVSAHFGICLMYESSILQKRLAERFLESGADVIVGHGPHVLQPMETYNTKDGRKTFIFYSLGNFIAPSRCDNKKIDDRAVSIIGYINIVKDSENKIFVHNLSYLPIFSHKNSEGITKVIIANSPEFKDIKNIIQIVFEGNKLKRLFLTFYYMSDIKHPLTFYNDLLLEYIILARWNKHKDL